MDTEQIKKIKAEHPEKFAEKRAILGSDKSAAEVIARQIEYDAANPPENAALQRVKKAAAMVKVHVQTLKASSATLERILAEVRAKFPDLDLSDVEIVMVPGGDDGQAEAALAELRTQVKQLQEEGRALQQRNLEGIKSLGDLRAQLEDAKGNQTALSDAQELLKRISECSNIKDVREMMKPLVAMPQDNTAQA